MPSAADGSQVAHLEGVIGGLNPLRADSVQLNANDEIKRFILSHPRELFCDSTISE